jgi:hypothetical protein
MNGNSVVIELSPRHYRLLHRMADQMGKDPETLSRELLEQALQESSSCESPEREAIRQTLQAAGRLGTLGPGLRQRIIPDVTLEEVQESLGRVGGKPLSEIILDQRGPRT